MGFLEVFKKKELSQKMQEAIVPAEEVFCSIQPVEFPANELEEQGFIRVADGLAVHADALVQYAPGAAVAMMEGGLYKAVFDSGMGVLQKSAQYPGLFLGNVVSPDKNNAIKAVAAWQQVSAAPQIALGLFTAVSLVTGQYFMAQTNQKLELLASGIETLQEFVEESDYNTLRACQNYFTYVQKNLRSIMENDIQRQSTATIIVEKKVECDALIGKYKNLIDRIRLKQLKKEDIQKTITTFAKYLSVYRTAIFMFSYATYLETLLVQNTDSEYLHSIAEEIKSRQSAYRENLDSWEQKFGKYIEKAKAFRWDRFLEDQGINHFWDKSLNRVKEAILLKREDHPLENARGQFASTIASQDDLSPLESVQQSLYLLDEVYNRPVEAIMDGNDIYVRLRKEA